MADTPTSMAEALEMYREHTAAFDEIVATLDAQVESIRRMGSVSHRDLRTALAAAKEKRSLFEGAASILGGERTDRVLTAFSRLEAALRTKLRGRFHAGRN